MQLHALEGDLCNRMAKTPVLYKTSSVDGTYFQPDEINKIEMEVWNAAHADAAYYRQINVMKAREGEEYTSNASAAAVFLALHNGPVTFRHTSSTCDGCTAITDSRNQITVYDLLSSDGSVITDYILRHSEVIIHELGHAIDLFDGNFGNNGIANYNYLGARPFVDENGNLNRVGLEVL